MTERRMPPGKQVIFVGDPMCSWCWGFAPELDRIADACAGRATLSVVTGGLRANMTTPMDDPMKADIKAHWEHVHEASGQPFDFAFFDRDGFVYNTEPPCRAVVTLRTALPDQAVAFFADLHRAFYAQGQDVTDADVLADLAAARGMDRALFLDAFDKPAMKVATSSDFQYARALGVSGFPTVVCRDGDQWAYLTVGYRRYADFGPVFQEWLDRPSDPADA
ncbi:MAG: DsbA family protein [Rhodobacterales bacterium]|nr:DsbA family protein [Rhodobacterales bacterium]